MGAHGRRPHTRTLAWHSAEPLLPLCAGITISKELHAELNASCTAAWPVRAPPCALASAHAHAVAR